MSKLEDVAYVVAIIAACVLGSSVALGVSALIVIGCWKAAVAP